MPEPSKKNPLGPTGVVAARRVRELRAARDWSYKELSDRLTAAGRPVPPLGLRRIEAEDRRIDADDLVALAATFGVSPSALLLPLASHGQTKVTGAGEVDLAVAWDWADGKRPLEKDADGESEVAFQDLSRPPDRRRFNYMTRAGRRRVGQLYDQIEGAEVIRDEDGDVREVRLPGGGRLFRAGDPDGS